MNAPDALRSPQAVRVALGERSYDILIGRGVSEQVGERLRALRPDGLAAVAIVADSRVAALHRGRIAAALERAGIRSTLVTVPPGEGSKSWMQVEAVCDGLLAARLGRDGLVLALGGGVIGDLAGFAASIARRGMDLVQIPTTLLAQVDSSVGGKTAINTRHGKNLVGTFHQPSLVLADTALLDTLPVREMRAGYAEVVKYGLINDPAFFEWLLGNWRELFAGGAAREHAVAVSCASKAEIVARDERETGDRALLNLGHTFGHALEAAAGYSQRLLHGEAVAIGTSLAFAFSAHLGLCGHEDRDRVRAHMRDVGLPTSISDIPGEGATLDQLLELIAQDKKVLRGALTFILVRGIGKAFVARDVEIAALREFLGRELSRSA